MVQATSAAEAPTRDGPDEHSTLLAGRRRLLLGVVAIELAVLYAPTVRWLVDRWTMSVWHNAHGMLVPLVVGYLVLRELGAHSDRRLASSPLGFLFLVPALMLVGLDAGVHTQFMSAVSIVIALPGLMLLLYGAARTKAVAFPLAFLAFMLPIPLALTEPIHLALRQVAAGASEQLVRLFGIPVLREGTVLHLPEAAVFVSDACSGFSTLYAALALAVLTAYTCAGWFRRAVVLGAAIPLAILANVVRVSFLVVAAFWAGTSILDTWVHPASGMFTFALALPAILYLGRPAAPRVNELANAGR